MNLAKTAELIEIPGGLRWAQGSIARWCHLTNVIEPSMCGRDATLCQITLTACSHCETVLHHEMSGLLHR